MPFQTWQIRPTGLNECVFNIVGAITEVDIVIKVNMVDSLSLIRISRRQIVARIRERFELRKGTLFPR